MSGLRVLVIDDSLTIRGMIEHLVGREPGSSVVGMATDGRAARGLAEDLMPNVITLDLDMPGLDGWRYLDSLRGTLHPPVVVVSSATKDGSPAADAAMMRGAAACFDKARLTEEADRFLDLLKRVASRRGQRRAPPPLRR